MYNRRCCRKCCNSNNIANIISNNTIVAAEFDITDNDSCECGFDKPESMFPDNAVLAQSYVPIQQMDKTYIPSVGLKMGTIFPELVRPYSPCQSLEEIAFIKAMNEVREGCNKC